MRQISKLTNNGRQSTNIVGENGEVIPFSLTFMPTQNCWYFNIAYAPQEFAANGLLLTNSPNILHQFKNLIPFGIACITTDGYEPQFLNDFIDGRVTMFLLTEAEVLEVEETYFQ